MKESMFVGISHYGISSVMMNSVGGTGEGVEHGWSLGVGGG